jgi:hypothetical protein
MLNIYWLCVGFSRGGSAWLTITKVQHSRLLVVCDPPPAVIGTDSDLMTGAKEDSIGCREPRKDPHQRGHGCSQADLLRRPIPLLMNSFLVWPRISVDQPAHEQRDPTVGLALNWTRTSWMLWTKRNQACDRLMSKSLQLAHLALLGRSEQTCRRFEPFQEQRNPQSNMIAVFKVVAIAEG